MKVLSMVTQRGGSGKTTLAVHLAIEALAAGFSTVALIDIDPQGSATRWGRRRSGGCPFVLPAQPETLCETISTCRDEGADLVIVDTPPRRDMAISRAVAVADLCVVPVKPGVFDVEAVEPTVRAIRMRRKAGCFVLSEVPPTGGDGEDARAYLVASYPRLPVLGAQLTRRKAFGEALIGGYGVGERDISRGKASHEARALFAEVLAELARVA